MMLHCRDVVDLILAYLEGTLDPGEPHAFESHIADCLNCWRFLQTYRETVALGQQLREEAIPPDVRERLGAFLRSTLPGTS
jgi:anti-sigma factor RsiW